MIAFNILLGIVPTLVLAASIAAGVDDDRRHRRMFVLVYGLWAITLSMWNWTICSGSMRLYSARYCR